MGEIALWARRERVAQEQPTTAARLERERTHRSGIREVTARPGRSGEHRRVRVRGADYDQPQGARVIPPATHRGYEEDLLSFARVAADPNPALGGGHRTGEVEERRQRNHPFLPDAGARNAPGDHMLGRPRIVAAGPQLDIEVCRVE